MSKISYEIHDNGGRPFIVYLNDTYADIYVQIYDYSTNKHTPDRNIIHTMYIKSYIGGNDYLDNKENVGNSIILQIEENKYMYIGSEIYTFELSNDDEIIQYYSPVGNNDVPYPYIVGKKFTYFMLDKEMIPTELLDLSIDAYSQFYGHCFEKDDDERYRTLNRMKAPFKTKLLYGRIY